jgi:hypothetical protein
LVARQLESGAFGLTWIGVLRSIEDPDWTVPVSFGRQKNLARRAVRPDGRFVRENRRKRVGRTTMLDLQQKGSFWSRFFGRLSRLLGR